MKEFSLNWGRLFFCFFCFGYDNVHVDANCSTGNSGELEQQFSQISQDGLPEIEAFKKTTVTSPILCSFDCADDVWCWSFVFLKQTTTENCCLSKDPNGRSSSQDSATFISTIKLPNCNEECPPWAAGRLCENLNPEYNLSLLPWRQGPGFSLKTIDIAFDVAWCTTEETHIYNTNTNNNGDGWTGVHGLANQVSIGESGVWVLSSVHTIFQRTGVTESNPGGTAWWQDVGALVQITSGPGIIWGVTSQNDVYYRKNAPWPWHLLQTGFKWVSCGKFGCWALTTDGRAYFRIGVTTSNPAGVSWVDTGGSFKQLDTGVRGDVYAVDNSGQLYIREGVSENSPEGEKWSNFGNKLFKHVSVGEKIIVALSLDGIEFRLEKQ